MVDIGKIQLWGHALAEELLYEAQMNTFSWQLIGFKVLTIFLKIQLSSMALLSLKNFLTKLASLLSAVRLCNLENFISAAKFKYLSLFEQTAKLLKSVFHHIQHYSGN